MAGATAAATSHARTAAAATSHTAKADAAKRRAALQRQRERRRVRAAAVFDKYQDGLSGQLKREKLAAFLQDVMKLPDAVDPKAVKVVEDAASGGKSTGNLPKSAVLDAVEHYGEYVKHARMVDALYAQFDSDGNNELGRDEFQQALEQHEARQTARAAVPVTDADLNVILERADADKDGQISRAEILPALAAWEELAAIKAEEAEAAACCVIL